MTRHLIQNRTHLLIGHPAEVGTVLNTAHTQHRLVSLAAPTTLADGRVSIRVELTDPTPPNTPGSRLGGWLLAATALAGLVAVAALIWGLVLAVLALITLISAAVAWIGAHLLGIAAALLVLLLLLGGGSKCAGIHCSGCSR